MYVTHSHVWHDLFTCGTWLTGDCDLCRDRRLLKRLLMYVTCDIHVYVCMYVCMHACACMCACMYVCMFATCMCLLRRLLMYVTWLIYMRHLTQSYVWHDSFTCVTRLIHMPYVTDSHVSLDSQAAVKSVVTDVGEMVLAQDDEQVASNAWHDSMTRSYVWHDSFVCVTWLVGMCDMPCLYVSQDTHMGVPTISRLLKNINLLCRISSLL